MYKKALWLFVFGLTLFTAHRVNSAVAITEHIYGKQETFNTRSKFTGDEHVIDVYLPPGYDKTAADGYPLLLLLDSNILFGHARSVINLFSLEGSIKPPVLVGVGYPEDDFKGFMDKRMRYFASAASKSRLGAEQFTMFLAQELLPDITERYAVNSHNRALYAPALPGIYGIYQLFNENSLFHNYILSGPRLWANEYALFEYEEAYSKKNASLDAKVYLSIGLLDDEKYVTAWRRFSSILDQRAYEGLIIEKDVMPDQGHFGGMITTLTRGIQFLYGSLRQ